MKVTGITQYKPCTQTWLVLLCGTCVLSLFWKANEPEQNTVLVHTITSHFILMNNIALTSTAVRSSLIQRMWWYLRHTPCITCTSTCIHCSIWYIHLYAPVPWFLNQLRWHLVQGHQCVVISNEVAQRDNDTNYLLLARSCNTGRSDFVCVLEEDACPDGGQSLVAFPVSTVTSVVARRFDGRRRIEIRVYCLPVAVSFIKIQSASWAHAFK